MRLKKHALNLILALSSILFVLVIYELGIRIYYLTSFNDRQFNSPADKTLKVSFFEIRDENYSLIKKEGVTRIAVMGDSYTYGYSLKDHNDAFPEKLEIALNKGGKRYEVLNFGFPGFNSMDVYWSIKNKVLKYDPDMIIYAYFSNDPEFTKGNLDADYCSLFMDMPKSALFTKIRLYNLNNRPYEDTQEYFLSLSDSNYFGWQCFKKMLSELKEEIEDKRLIMFMIPITYENKVDTQINSRLHILSKEKGIDYYDRFIYDFWNKTVSFSDEQLRIDPKGGETHYNGFTNEIIADVLSDYIIGEEKNR